MQRNGSMLDYCPSHFQEVKANLGMIYSSVGRSCLQQRTVHHRDSEKAKPVCKGA